MRKLALLLALTAGALVPVTAVAQDSPSKSKSSKKKSKKSRTQKAEENHVQAEEPKAHSFSNEQILLNNQAVIATKEQNYQKAEQLFNAMLQIGEFNIIWMNLGRTYTSQNKCIEAAEAFQRVATAPPIAEVPVEVINEKTATYIQELNNQCSSTIVLNCNPPDTMVTIDGGSERMCTSEPIQVVPGRHSIYAKTSYGFNSITIETTPFETTMTDVVVIDYEQVAIEAGVTAERLRGTSKLLKTTGYSLLGGGAALLAAGAGVMGYFYFSYYPDASHEYLSSTIGEEEFNQRKSTTEAALNASYAMLAIGGAALVGGIALVVLDAVKYTPQIEKLEAGDALSNFRLSPVFSHDFAGLSFGANF